MNSVPTLQSYGRDPLTGGICPPGTQSRVEFEPVQIGRDETLRSTYQGIEEVADFWQPGDADCGIAPSERDGRILPRIDHVRWGYPLTDITGRRLQVKDTEIEAARRTWYALQMNAAPRLTAVQHIIGKSRTEWHGRMVYNDVVSRDEWRATLWEPENLKALMLSYRGIYSIDWQRLPEDKILAPLSGLHRKAERAGVATEPMLRLKLQRAKADLDVIKAIAVAVEAGDMVKATQAHSRLSANAETYNAEAAKLEGIGVGLGAFQRKARGKA